MPQRSCQAIVGGVVGGFRDGIASDDGCGAVGGVGGVVDEVDFAQESLLMMLEFAHHARDGGGSLWVLITRRGVVRSQGEVQKEFRRGKGLALDD